MASESETIKIVVEVVDKFSKPLVDLKRQLEQISDKGEGAKHVASGFDKLRESMVNVARSITGMVMPSLRVLGLGFTGLAGTIAASVAALKGFATSTAQLSRLSRETGITIDKMRELEAAGRRVGLSAAEMRAGFRGFSDEMDKMRVGVSAAANELRQRGLGFVVDNLKRMAGDANKQLEYTLSIIDRISNPRHKREVAALLLGPAANLATLTGKEREKAIEEYKKTVGALDKETKDAAERFEESMQKLQDSMEKLVNALAKSGALDKIGVALERIVTYIDELNKPPVPGSIADKLWGPRSEEWHLPKGAEGESGFTRFFRGLIEGFRKVEPGYPAEGAAPEGGPAKKMSYVPGGGRTDLATKASFVPGGGVTGGPGETIDLLKQGVSAGVQDAFKKMMFGEEGGGAAGGDGATGTARVIRASLGGGRRGDGSGGDGEAKPGARPPMGEKAVPAPNEDGEYNYFQKRGVTPPPKSALKTIETPFGNVTVHPEAEEDVRGFMDELKESGAPIKRFGSYADRNKRWGGGKSSHAYGTAFDIDDEIQLSPAMRKWIAENPERWAAMKKKWNMGQPLPRKDPGHVEWKGRRKVAGKPPTSDTQPGQPGQSGKMTWFGSTPGWHDPSQPAGMAGGRETATGTAFEHPGFASAGSEGLGEMHEVTLPDGRTVWLRKTDVGPEGVVDITSGAAKRIWGKPGAVPEGRATTRRSELPLPRSRPPEADGAAPPTTPPIGQRLASYTEGERHGGLERQRWLGGIPQGDPYRDKYSGAVPRERMMESSRQANQYARVEGDARVRIELAGFPRGTKTQSSASGIFSDVELHRGNTMPFASEST